MPPKAAIHPRPRTITRHRSLISFTDLELKMPS
jgi:hypothetical protein